ncbi:MAG: DNA polymerase III subunit delta [Bacteroidota bacterium]|nr:DNA polymerase III subunit delta [Bacteroidota bacterium]
MLFKEIIGVDKTKSAILNAVKSNHFAHASLIRGISGSANLSFALAIAQYLQCENPLENDSCGTCFSCNQHAKLQHPDCHYYFPLTTLEKVGKDDVKSYLVPFFRTFAINRPFDSINDWGNHIGTENKQFNIPVEEARSILKNATMSSFQGGAKIILVWLPEYLHNSASNAILKVLEEPPANTYFLLVTCNMESLLTTIISRCQTIQIERFTNEEIQNYLKNKLNIESTIAFETSLLAEGSIGNALKLINEGYDAVFEPFTQFMRLCFGFKVPDILVFNDELSKKGREFQKSFLTYGINIIRNVMLIHSGNGAIVKLNGNQLDFVKKFSESININQIDKFNLILQDGIIHVERNGNSKVIFLDIAIQLHKLFRGTR